MRHALLSLLSLLAVVALSACESEKRPPRTGPFSVSGETKTECPAERRGTVIGARCNPQPIRVIKQPEHKVEKAMVSVIYSVNVHPNFRGDRHTFRILIATASRGWNFTGVESAQLTVETNRNNDVLPTTVEGVTNQNNKKVNGYYHEMNHFSIPLERATHMLHSDSITVRMGGARFAIPVSAKQMSQITDRTNRLYKRYNRGLRR